MTVHVCPEIMGVFASIVTSFTTARPGLVLMNALMLREFALAFKGFSIVQAVMFKGY